MKYKYSFGNLSRYRSELMGIAILFVIIFHYIMTLVLAWRNQQVAMPESKLLVQLISWNYTWFGSIGVEMFIILSSIGLYYSFSKNPDCIAFYKRRIQRIAFPYIAVGLVFWTIKDIHMLDLGINRFFKDLFFVTYFTDGVITLWFILFICVMYLIYPLFYQCFSCGKHRLIKLSVFCIGYIGFMYYLFTERRPIYNNVEIAMTRVPLFAIGCYLAPYVKNKKEIPIYYAALFTALTFLLNYICNSRSNWPGLFYRLSDSLFGLGLIMLIAWCCEIFMKNQKGIISRCLCFFGKYSLELYMIHVTIRNLMELTAYKPFYFRYYLIMVVIAIILSIMLQKVQNVLLNRGK